MGWNEFIDNIISIGLMAAQIPKFIEKIALMVPRLYELFFYITDPRKLLNDLIFGIIKGLYMIFDAILDSLFGDIRRKFGNKSDKGSNQASGSIQKEKCMPPSLVEILLLVLCPPLALILKMVLMACFMF